MVSGSCSPYDKVKKQPVLPYEDVAGPRGSSGLILPSFLRGILWEGCRIALPRDS